MCIRIREDDTKECILAGEFYSKTVLDCADIQLELEKVAQAHGMEVEDIWFDLLKVHTLVRTTPKMSLNFWRRERSNALMTMCFLMINR